VSGAASHTRLWSTDYPGLLFVLADHSGSMVDEPWGSDVNLTKAEGLARAVNELFVELIVQCLVQSSRSPTGEVKHRLDVGVVGYRGSGPDVRVGPAFGGMLSERTIVPIDELAGNPVVQGSPIWLEPTGRGRTPMGEAFEYATPLIARWANEHPSSFPPVVINVTDGAFTGVDPTPAIDALRRVRTHDGETLLFNVNLSQFVTPPQVVFPATPRGLDAFANQLFEWSSPLPERMLRNARDQGIAAEDGARCFAFNPDFATLSKVLRIGSTQVETAGDGRAPR
jgi:hypothetical protein